MNFWHRLEEFGDAIALIDEHGKEIWSYKRLAEAVVNGSQVLHRPRKKLVFLFANNDVGAILGYLSVLQAGHLVYLGQGIVDWIEVTDLIRRYHPDILLWKGGDQGLPPHYRRNQDLFGYRLAECSKRQPRLGEDLTLLLSTSGSLGSPKLVRLSRKNVETAASQVAQALRLNPSHRAITSLPLNFVLGLSVVHSHLQMGASLVVTKRSVQDQAFWRLLDETGATSLAGVPWTFRMLRMISFDPERYPSLQYLSLSGGRLEPELLLWLKQLAARGLDIFSMYGQTEASGRMCVLPPERFLCNGESVGLPVKDGEVWCGDDGQINYRGPNVMLGYARSRRDLSDVDDLGGKLPTGDCGHLDAEGYLHITGRISRIAKLFGMRINLDEIESILSENIPVLVASNDHLLFVFVEKNKPEGLDERLLILLRRLRVPEHCVQVRIVANFPRNEAGKLRYGDLFKSAT